MKDKDGFTLIEMLVCIGIIATLGIAIGVSSVNMSKNSTIKRNKEYLREILEAAEVYSNMSSFSCSLTTDFNDCSISLGTLISNGLLDNNITNIVNPLTNSNTKFNSYFKVYIAKKDYQIQAGIKCKNSIYVTLSSLDDFEDWGTCS